MKRAPLYFAFLLVPLGLVWLVRSLEAGEPGRIGDVTRKLALADQARERGDRAADARLRGDANRMLAGVLRGRIDRRNAGVLLILAGIGGLALHRWGVTGAALSSSGVSVIALGFLMLGPLRAYESLRRGGDPPGLAVGEGDLAGVCLHDAAVPLLTATIGGAVSVALSRAN